MTDLSLDIESFGTRPGAAVVGIGACFFDAAAGTIGDSYYQAVNLASCVNAGMHIEPGTVMWWMQQSEEARMAIVASTVTLEMALSEFREWLHARCARGDLRPWMRGPSFDGALLTAAYRAAGIELPWHYMNERCHRTLTARNPSVPEPTREGTFHNARDDAIHQARWLIAIAQHHRARAAA